MCLICDDNIDPKATILEISCNELKYITASIFPKSLKKLYLKHCVQLEFIEPIPNLTFLELLYNPKIREVPIIDSLVKLFVRYCPLIERIPVIRGLKVLNCSFNQSLSRVPRIKGLKELMCCDLPLLKYVPNIKGLRTLYCTVNPLILRVPRIKKLQTLNCGECPLITHVSDYKCLKTLYCENCPKLVDISNIPNLQCIQAPHCRLLISRLKRINYCVRDRSRWFDVPQNIYFNNYIRKLKVLQTWFRRVILRKRLQRLIPKIMPLYYDPFAKGGYMDKKNLLNFLNEILS